MKKAKLFLIMLLTLSIAAFICACTETNSDTDSDPAQKYEISLDTERSFELEVGEEVDYTQYFIVKDLNGNRIVVSKEMLDLSQADTSVPGIFWVTLKIGDQTLKAEFTVTVKQTAPTDPDDPSAPGYRAVFEKYADASAWNFAVKYKETFEGKTYEENYEYLGLNVKNTYTADDGNQYTDYLGYDTATDVYTFYLQNEDGSYTAYSEETDEFAEYTSYLYLIDLTALSDYSFTQDGNHLVAEDPATAGNAVLGEYTGSEWTSLGIDIANEQIVKIVASMADGYTQQYTFSNHGSVRFTLPDGSGSSGTDTPVTPSDTMEKQDYNAATFDKGTLQEKMLNADGAIGLPSKGDIHALVIPVQFVNDTITDVQMENLRKAFNGTETDTGWESVKSYYDKSSYGNLKLTFDIQEIYHAQHASSYYASYKSTGYYEGQSYPITGDTIILEEALNHYQSKLDLTDYDTNNDGCIDAVYLIYSAPVDYDNADFYWAYVTWYYGSTQYDGLDAYYYLFASFGFMDESTPRDEISGYNKIDGLKVNADTYIHETGHLLGLDDYYDYDERSGCNEGLGGADMMDYNVGDHGVYSKTMLGWLSPTVVNQTKTVTLQPSVSNASAILIPLNFDNSYFSEYLLIDLYSATGLNELHSKQAQTSDAVLYGGASYGVRIYHVSSSVTNSYSTDYQSFTDYNNSDTKYALVKLVEADGTKKFSNSGGSAAKSDLWLAGSSLLGKFPSYTRNDGKKINFNVSIDSVTATQARVTVTFQ